MTKAASLDKPGRYRRGARRHAFALGELGGVKRAVAGGPTKRRIGSPVEKQCGHTVDDRLGVDTLHPVEVGDVR